MKDKLSPADFKKLNMRFTQTALKSKADGQTKTLWEQVSAKGHREGKREAQHKIRAAFALDPACGSSFATALQELSLTDTIWQNATWMSRKELLGCYSESEAEELVENGSIETRSAIVSTKHVQHICLNKLGRYIVSWFVFYSFLCQHVYVCICLHYGMAAANSLACMVCGFVCVCICVHSGTTVANPLAHRLAWTVCCACRVDTQRPHPTNPNRNQFRKVTEGDTKKAKRSQTFGASTTQEVNSAQVLRMHGTMVRRDMNGKDLQKRALNEIMDLPRDEESGDEEGDKKKPKVTIKKEKQEKFSWDEQSICCLPPCDVEAMATKMHGLLIQKIHALKDSAVKLKQSVYGTTKKIKEINMCVESVEDVNARIASAIKKSTAAPRVKSLLIEAAKKMKAAGVLIKECKAALRADTGSAKK
jgi:hypothetical protein